MKRSVLCPMLLAAVGLIYIVLFTCAVNYIAEQVFRGLLCLPSRRQS